MKDDATYKKNSDQYEELKEDKQKREKQELAVCLTCKRRRRRTRKTEPHIHAECKWQDSLTPSSMKQSETKWRPLPYCLTTNNTMKVRPKQWLWNNLKKTQGQTMTRRFAWTKMAYYRL